MLMTMGHRCSSALVLQTDGVRSSLLGESFADALVEVDFWTAQPAFAAVLRILDRLSGGLLDDPTRAGAEAGAAEISTAFDSGGTAGATAQPLSNSACLPVRLFIVKLLLQ